MGEEAEPLYDDDTMRVMSKAYGAADKELRVSGVSDKALQVTMAVAIIRAINDGERDAARLATLALAEVGIEAEGRDLLADDAGADAATDDASAEGDIDDTAAATEGEAVASSDAEAAAGTDASGADVPDDEDTDAATEANAVPGSKRTASTQPLRPGWINLMSLIG